MKKLIVAEKSQVATEFLCAIGESKDTCDVVISYTFQMHKRKLPKLSFNQIPFTDIPEQHVGIDSLDELNIITGMIMVLDGKPISTHRQTDSEAVESMKQHYQVLRERLKDGYYAEVICIVDPDPVGYYCARLALEALQTPSEVPVSTIKAYTLEHAALLEQYKHRRPLIEDDIEFMTQSLGQQGKLAFDYLWNANAALVLGEALKFSGLKATPISKYQLTMILYLNNKYGSELINEYDAMSTLSKWEGTGKYKADDVYLGSPRSLFGIYTGLVGMGFLVPVQDKKSHYTINPQWKQFISLMHPRTLDLDLPFRVEEWRQSPSPQAIKRYINTMFGRQLRYQRNEIKAKA